MFEFIAGIALGAAFSPFWIMLFNLGSGYVKAYLAKKEVK